MDSAIRELINVEAPKYGVDPQFLYSIVMVESSGRVWVSKVEFHYPYLVTPEIYARKLGISKSTEVINQRTSYGLVQIMGGVAREQGWESHLPRIYLPKVNVTLGLRLIKKLMKKYDGNMDKVAAAYNWGHAAINRETGKYMNQEYVDKINKYYKGGAQ